MKRARATGREMALAKQIGEHLVAAELGRRGYIAAPFAGNVPLFDLLAADQSGHTVPIQVKTIRGRSWQFSVDAFLTIDFVDGCQIVRGQKILTNPDLVCVFVLLGPPDQFFIFRLQDLQDFCARVYKPRGPASKNPDSRHCAISPAEVAQFRDNWDLIGRSLK